MDDFGISFHFLDAGGQFDASEHRIPVNTYKPLLHRQQPLDILLVRWMHFPKIGEVTLPFGGLFRENMAFVSVLSFNLTRTREGEPLFGAGICFHFRHMVRIIYFFFTFGAINMVILFPSSLGSCSTFPTSSRSWASLSSRISPFSL